LKHVQLCLVVNMGGFYFKNLLTKNKGDCDGEFYGLAQ